MSQKKRKLDDKWTMMMYTNDFNLMLTYAQALKSSNILSKDNIVGILNTLNDEGIYRPRNGVNNLTGSFKVIQLAWYMFGYYQNGKRGGATKKFVFSPLGNLLLENNDPKKRSLIFATMLYANAFKQPFSRMNSDINIYPFRLIFKLLRDPRIDYRLYSDEVFYLLMFLHSISENEYEQLIDDILNLRAQDSFDKLKMFKENEHALGLACHEWRYTSKILSSGGVVEVNNDHANRKIGSLQYGSINKKGKPNASRTYDENYVTLNPDLAEYIDELLANYSYAVKPFDEEEMKSRLQESFVTELYSFYPPELLRALGQDTKKDKAVAKMLNIASGLDYYAREEVTTGDEFEWALTDAFNLLEDVEAQRIAGPGNVDIECVYAYELNKIKKFDVEAKSTGFKLQAVNSKRLNRHREKVKSQYTMVVTPRFSHGVLSDIEDEDIVVVKSATLANYLYNYILQSGRSISYNALDSIITNHLGQDITEYVEENIYDNFGHGAKGF